MKLYEARRPGVLFKRAVHDYWQVLNEEGVTVDAPMGNGPIWTAPYTYDDEDLDADDWQIREKSVTITSTQFWDAFYAALNNTVSNNIGDVVSTLHQHLGLED